MKFEYKYKNNEANFGGPIKNQIVGGTHISFEIILKKDNKFISLRRPNAIPGHEHPLKKKTKNGLLYFCHDLIRYGESIDNCIKRIVKSQSGVKVKTFKIVDIESSVQKKDKQWAFTPYIIVEVDNIPKKGKYGNEITEVVEFDISNVPNDFGWWERDELKMFIEQHATRR